jgi:hypothetical protein
MHEKDGPLREKIRERLAAGLQTQMEPVPRDNHEFEAIVGQLQVLREDQLDEKLVVAGFRDTPYGKDWQRCYDCMYYLVHRKWCALPPLAVPVEPDWWCRLWRL